MTTHGWVLRGLLGMATASAMMLAAGAAKAQPADEVSPGGSQGQKGASPLDVFALRAGAGYGHGLRAAGVAEFWPFRHVGIGAEAAILNQSDGNWANGRTEYDARTLSPFLGLRVAAPEWGSFILHVGGGYAFAHRTKVPPLCFFMLQGECPDPVTESYRGLVASSAFGWLGHFREYAPEAGLFGHVAVVIDRRGVIPNSYLATLNIEVGFGI